MDVNVETIMNEIRQKIKEEGLNAVKLPFEDIPPKSGDLGSDIGDYNIDNLINSCTYMNNHFEVSIWHQLYFSRPFFRSVITFGIKVIRRLTRFFIQPIVEDQNNFNMHVTRSMNQIRNYLIQKDNFIEESDKLIDNILVKQAQLSDRLARLEKENVELRRGRN